MKVLAVIPARYQSSRLPGKPIVDICGKPMIWWVYQQASKAKEISDIIIATDDKRIEEVCKQLDMKVIMTSPDHDTPTSRLYEVSTLIDADLYLQLMGDEPLINAACFPLIIPSVNVSEYYVAALSNTLKNPTEVIDFSNQKVVINDKHETLFISRSPIPYPKGSLDFKYSKVTGVQIFSKAALKFYNHTPKTDIELAEENDLMRFVYHNIPVYMFNSPYKTISVDTFKDLEKVREIIQTKEKNYGSSI